MKVKTSIAMTGEWQVEVHTCDAQYKNKGKYYSFCFLQNYRGETVSIVSKYTNDEKEAIDFHQELCQKAKDLFSLKQ